MLIDWVESDLQLWGRHMRGSGCNLGYPAKTIDARMQDGVLSIDGLRSMRMPDFPERVELAEQVILRMDDYLIHVALAVYTTHDDMTRRDQARMLSGRIERSVSPKTLIAWLNALHHEYAGYYRGMIDMLDDQKCLTVASHR